LVWVAIGTWKRRIAAWRYGFMAIGLAAVEFIAQVLLHMPAVGAGQKAIIIIASFVGGSLVAIYWSFVWYRQKGWFSFDGLA